MEGITRRVTPAVLCGVLVGGSAPSADGATARNPASITAIVRTVKTGSPAGVSWQDARLGQELDSGQRVRTGRRSKAGMRFSDGSALRVDELSEVVVQGGGTRDVAVPKGTLFGS